MRGRQAGLGAPMGLLLLGLLAGCTTAGGGSFASGNPELWDGEISSDTYRCRDLKVPVAAIDEPIHISDLDDAAQDAIASASLAGGPPIALDHADSWIVVRHDTRGIDLLRPLTEAEKAPANDFLRGDPDYERFSLTTEFSGSWMVKASQTCALTVDLGEQEPLGVWIDPDHTLDPASNTVHLLVLDSQCGGDLNMPERVRIVRLEERPDEVALILTAIPLPQGGYTCQGFPPTPLTLTLDEPLGDRKIVDVSRAFPRELTGSA